MTRADVIEAFGRLKTGSRSGQRLPHKPLLVLLALGRWATAAPSRSPACKEDRPKPEFLAWHREQVFRGRARS
jgi:hypothetical protein